MKLKAFKILSVTAFIASGTLVSCIADDNSPGLEYMPDMYRSPAVEAYVDYGEVGGIYDEEAQKMVEDKFSYVPPAGTIPYTNGEGYLAPYNHGAPENADKTHGLYGIAQDTAGRNSAINDLNPIAYTESNAKEGKVLFERFCIHCHGEKGDGQGSVVTNSNGKFPSPGAYKKELTAGEIFYTITYGKGSMGSHASQVNPMERWKIVHYVEKLAGKDKEIEEVLLFDANTDTDKDGVMDNVDECPSVKGSPSNHGCPEVDEATQKVIDFAIEGLVFETGSANLATSSYNGLDNLSKYLVENDKMALLINGHTDNVGNSNGNQALSLKRAKMVKLYLTEKGVDKTRITSIGYGQNKPIADNSSEEGRLANRRVEFRVFN